MSIVNRYLEKIAAKLKKEKPKVKKNKFKLPNLENPMDGYINQLQLRSKVRHEYLHEHLKTITEKVTPR